MSVLLCIGSNQYLYPAHTPKASNEINFIFILFISKLFNNIINNNNNKNKFFDSFNTMSRRTKRKLILLYWLVRRKKTPQLIIQSKKPRPHSQFA